ncbi:MAG: carbohydrate ABC transporter permease [Eubacteriales bacterium]|nr:carbohydrate ABC transporter permease [Eubacteriales bacterium]
MKTLVKILVGLLALVVLSPVLFLLTGSLMGDGELQTALGPALTQMEGYAFFRFLPRYPTLASYAGLLLDTPSFFVMFWNSVKLTGAILIGQLFVGTPAAWAFAQYRFPGKRLLFLLYILLMMMPFQVMMLSNYLVLDSFSLLDTHEGIILPAVFSTFPVFIMYRFFQGIPKALLDAARLDGAGDFRLFWNIGIPLGAPGIFSVLVLGFLEYWNLLEQPMAFLKTKALWPLSLFLPNLDLSRAGVAFAASAVAMIPAVLVFLSGQEYLEQGILAAAVKE